MKPTKIFIILAVLVVGFPWARCAAGAPALPSEIRIVVAEGQVEVLSQGAARWLPAQTNVVLYPKDSVRTGPKSRMSLRWTDQSVISFGPLTEVEILPEENAKNAGGLHLLQGLLSFFHRDTPGRLKVVTRASLSGIVGTEFVLSSGVEGTNFDVLSVIEGEVSISNSLGFLILTNHEQASVAVGEAPKRTAGFLANNVLQWALYYPGVLDLEELRLNTAQRSALGLSLEAYHQGDLLAALAAYPDARTAESADEAVLHAGLLLAVGEVQEAERLLSSLPGTDSHSKHLAQALRLVIAAVKRQTQAYEAQDLTLASEKLAASYYEQSRAEGDKSLEQARALALGAAHQSPDFSFAWARAGELEFSFRQTSRAREWTEKALALSPRNAQATALKGFLLAADNRVREAQDWFERAIALDPALANGWLGRGLCRIRKGDLQGGREDLLIAAALEPRRAMLRSYLGKAFTDAGKNALASKELRKARDLDPNDPTAWLYSALLKQQENKINSAVEDLERSQQRNANRGLFRSQRLLDEDRAVGSANLASIYRDAGMTDVSIQEAARAVTYDYASASAHLFLSDSYNELRDPTRFNLRYETVWFNELLLANLLSPVGGGRLSQQLSQQEYSKLFERDGMGVANSTMYRSDNRSVTELASQFGTYGSSSYSLDLDYQHNGGVRPNNGLDSIEWYTTVKQQLTPQDTVLALVKYEDYHSGDNFQYYNPADARPHFRFDETQHPIVVGAWHHEWSPGMHTIVLGGRLETEQHFSDQQAAFPIADFVGGNYLRAFDLLDVSLSDRLEIYTVEAQQIFQNEWQTLVAGGRFQDGNFESGNLLNHPAFNDGSTNAIGAFPTQGVVTNVANDFRWTSGYLYETVKLPGQVNLTAGVAYERILFPANFRSAPIQSGTESRDQFSPKAALVWQAAPQATVRGIYAQSLGGVSLDESFRLEPTQLGGLPQSFRTVIPESLVGSVSAPAHEVGGAALDLKFSSRTYVSLQGGLLHSDVRQTLGLFQENFGAPFPNIFPIGTRQNLSFEETSFQALIHQLLSEEWAVGVSYYFTHADLRISAPTLSDVLPSADVRADLHQWNVSLFYNHPSGVFAQLGWNYYYQDDSQAISGGVITPTPAEGFDQLNLLVGFRFPRQHGDIAIGGLDLMDNDYRLNPVTAYSELPRKRALYARVRFRF